MPVKFGLDLGSANLRVVTGVRSAPVSEPSAVALDRETGRVLYVGQAAQKIFESPPSNVVLMRPFLKGLIANTDITAGVLAGIAAKYFGRIHRDDRLLLTVPCEMTEVEEVALAELAARVGLRNTYMVYSPLAILFGAGFQPDSAMLVVEIGAAWTNIMLLCGGELLYKRSLPIAGAAFDDAIVTYLHRTRQTRVPLRTAEQLKISIGNIWSDGPTKVVQVRGRDSLTTQSKIITVSSEDLYRAFDEPMAAIMEAICIAITKIPARFVNRVFTNGIILTGGGSLLAGMDKMINGVTGVKITRLKDAFNTPARGLMHLGEYLPDRLSPAIRNVTGLFLKQQSKI